MKTTFLPHTEMAKSARTVLVLFTVALMPLGWPGSVHAQEGCDRVAPAVIVDEVWSSGVVCDNSDITVASLTVMPGVTVLITGNYTIRVPGIVRVAGTPSAPVVFRPPAGNTNGWQGFYFENSNPGSEFDHCRIEGARNSALRLVRSTPTIRNTVFRSCRGPEGGAIYADIPDRTLSISHCVFEANRAVNNGGAIWCDATNGRLELVACDFERNVANPSRERRNTAGGAIYLNGQQCLVFGDDPRPAQVDELIHRIGITIQLSDHLFGKVGNSLRPRLNQGQNARVLHRLFQNRFDDSGERLIMFSNRAVGANLLPK